MTRSPLEDKLRSGGDAILDTVVLKVDERHKASVHDPSRLLAGTLTPGLTWGLAGLLGAGDPTRPGPVLRWIGRLAGALLAPARRGARWPGCDGWSGRLPGLRRTVGPVWSP